MMGNGGIAVAKKRILTLGRCYMELGMTMQALPKEGEQVNSEGRYGFSGGGSGLLSAIGIARMGVDSMLCARVGNDVYGNRLRSLLESSGVSVRHVTVDKKSPTSLKVTLVPELQRHSSVFYDGAAALLSAENVEEAFVSYPDALVLCGDLPFALERTAAEFAQDDDLPVFLKVPMHSPDRPLHSLGRLKAAVLGEEEIASYTGSKPDSVADYLQASIKLSSRIRADYFLFDLGARGTYVTDGKYSDMIAPVPATFVDRNGAPECFLAALSARYLFDGDMKNAASYARAASALCGAKTGTVGSLPTLALVEELLERMGE